jgi:hypothetical protein
VHFDGVVGVYTSSTVLEASGGDVVRLLSQICTHNGPVLTTTLLFSLFSNPSPRTISQ